MFYPIATDRQPKITPYVTYSLAGLNIVIGLWWLWGTGADGDLLRDLAFIPAEPTWYGLLTSMFMHGGLAHLFGNMLYLVLFGRNVEDAMGHVLFACSYLVCGAAAMIMHLAVVVAFQPEQMGVATVGASGAISGLLGLFVVRFYRTKITIWYFVLIRMGTFQVLSIIAIGLWFGMQLWSGMRGLTESVGGVAYWAHVGGFVFGMGYALLVGMESEGTAEYRLVDAQDSLRTASWERALAHASRVLREDPDNADALVILARSCAQRRDPDGAARYFLRALPVLLESGDLAKVAGTYVTMFEALPTISMPLTLHFRVAAALVRAGSYSAAATAYHRIASQTDDARAWEQAAFRMGQVCLQHTGDLTAARSAFEAILQRNPSSELAQQAQEGLRRVDAEAALGGETNAPAAAI